MITSKRDSVRHAEFQAVYLEKRYYNNTQLRRSFAVYVPTDIDNDPSKYAKIDLSTRANQAPQTLMGSCRILAVSFGRLLPTTHQLLPPGAPRVGAWFNYGAPAVIGDNAPVYCVGEAGEYVPYTVTVETGGAIAWSYVTAVNAGVVRVTVTQGATTISTVYIDTYDGPAYLVYLAQQQVLVENLPAGTYTVTVAALGMKNVGSIGYRVYDLGVDAVAPVGLGGATGFFVPSKEMPLAQGNWEYAARVRPSGSVDPADFVYCWGTHGNEQALTTFSLLLDGVDYNAVLGNVANMQGTRWAGSRLVLDYTLPLQWGGGVQWCTHRTISVFDPTGVEVTTIRTLVLDARLREEYISMVITPDKVTAGWNQATLLSAPREAVPYLDYTPSPANVSYVPADDCPGSLVTDGTRSICAAVLRPGNITAAYPRDANSLPLGLIVFRTTADVKVYSAVIYQGVTATADILVAAGDVMTSRVKYTFLEAS